MATKTAPPPSLEALAERFDPDVIEVPGGRARIRLEVRGEGAWEARIKDGRVEIAKAGSEGDADALITGDQVTWERMTTDYRAGLEAFRHRRLVLRRNLNLGIGFLAATSGHDDPARLRFSSIETDCGQVSMMEAGEGEPVIMLHGLGATKIEFMPTLAALAEEGFRAIGMDLPGFGDTDKPFPAPYDARFFARWVESVLDALDIRSAHVLGHSMGGRVAIEVGIRRPDRTKGLVLMTPSLAWRHRGFWVPYLKLVRPELGAIQPAPKPIVDRIVRSVVPGAASNDWAAAGVDEFLRSYYTPRGRAAFDAAARNISLEEGEGDEGFWTRLEALQPRTLFIWGRRDQLVPIGFERHVKQAVPAARHVEIDCAHVPQVERPRQTHRAIVDFLRDDGRACGATTRGSTSRPSTGRRMRTT